MNYYTVGKPTTTYYTKTTSTINAYAVNNPTTTYYVAGVLAIRTWLSLANQDAKTWAKLKELGLTTWAKLGATKGFAIFYYPVPDPTTIYYEVSV